MKEDDVSTVVEADEHLNSACESIEKARDALSEILELPLSNAPDMHSDLLDKAQEIMQKLKEIQENEMKPLANEDHLAIAKTLEKQFGSKAAERYRKKHCLTKQ